jgi:photosystem II stability/assembly factor-like uncharacterized protein
MKNITNPFANNAANPAVVAGIQPKLGTITPQVTVMPTVPPSGFALPFTAADKANILFSTAYVLNGVANNQFLTLNQTQINAISNVHTAWSATNPYGTALPGVVTIPASGLRDTVITMQAVNYLQTTGLLTTTQDLIESNGSIQMVTGFAPNGARTMTIHNQKVICEIPGQNLWAASNVGNGASWNPLSVGDLETYSDQPVAVDQCYGFVIVFGNQSLEWWQDVGNNPFPYVIVPNSAQNIGLPAVFSRQQFMGDLVFLGRFKTGQMHFMRTNGTGVPLIISTPDIDQIINNFPDGQYQDAVASTDDFNGHPVYIVTFLSAKRTFLYDGITKVWSELQSGTQEYQRHLVTLRATLNNGTLGSDYESGNVYFIDPNNYTDNGFIIKREWVSKHVRNSGNIFSVPLLELVMQIGTGSQINQQTLYANSNTVTIPTILATSSLKEAGSACNQIAVYTTSTGDVAYSNINAAYATWTSNNITTGNLWGCAVIAGSATVVYAVGDNGQIWSAKTTPNFSGPVINVASWKQDTSSTSTATLRDIFQANSIIAVGDGGVILANTGAGFVQLPSGVTTNLRSGCVFGFRGAAFIAGDGGLIMSAVAPYTSWSIANTGVTENLHCIRPENERMIAVGDNGTILSTNDGVTWTKENSGTTQNLNSVWSDANFNGDWVACGNNGTVLFNPFVACTAPTWIAAASSNTTNNLYGITNAFDTGFFIAVGDHGTLATSLDVGNTWTIFEQQTLTPLIVPIGAQDIWPFVHNPHVELMVSTDGGNIWSQPEPAELGEVGQYRTRVYWRQLGTGRDFLFKFRCTDPVPFIVAAGYATIKPGTPD